MILLELWKDKSEVYKDRNLINAGYYLVVQKQKEIYKVANRDMVQKKICILYSPCQRVLRKFAESMKSGCGTDRVCVSSLLYCDDMNFLRDHEIQLKGVSAVDEMDGT